MSRFLRNTCLLILLATALPLAAQDGGYKIGFVNTARVLKEAPQAREVEERLKAEFEPREAQLRAQREEILDMEETLKGDLLDANGKRRLEREIRLKVSQLKFLEQEFREDQNLRRNEEIRELQQVISKVLEMQGDTGGFDLILTEGVSYVSDQIDITAELVERLKQLSESGGDGQ